MKPHHQRAIQKLRDAYEPDPRYLALILVGSLAAGCESDTSDVDHLIVSTDAEFARRLDAEQVHYWTHDFCDYPGGYVEGKVIDHAFLTDAAERGSEPCRAQFAGARVIFSKLPGLAGLLARIPVYPEAERDRKIRAFHAQMTVLRGYLDYGIDKQDAYITMRSAAGMVLYGGRLILAHNRILFPYHKWFRREVRRAPDKPAGFDDLLDALLATPTKDAAARLADTIVDFMQLQPLEPTYISRFVIDTEWNWRHGAGAVEDW